MNNLTIYDPADISYTLYAKVFNINIMAKYNIVIDHNHKRIERLPKTYRSFTKAVKERDKLYGEDKGFKKYAGMKRFTDSNGNVTDVYFVEFK